MDKWKVDQRTYIAYHQVLTYEHHVSSYVVSFAIVGLHVLPAALYPDDGLSRS